MRNDDPDNDRAAWPPVERADGAGLPGLWLDMMVGIDQPAYALALDGRFLWVNPACEAFFGRSTAELLRLRFADITHPDDRMGDGQRLARLVAGDAVAMQVDKRFVRPDGSTVWARLNVHRPQGVGDHSPQRAEHLLVLARELGSDDASREALRRSEAQLRLALDASRAGTWDWNLLTDIVEYSDSFARLLRHEGGDFHRDFVFRERLHPTDRQRVLDAVQQALAHGGVFDECYRLRCFDGRYRRFRGRGMAYRAPDGRLLHFSGVLLDWHEPHRQQLLLQRSQRRMAHLARHDPLTGLPNRLHWNASLQDALLHAQRHGERIAVLMLDLDNFKDVNDSLGHAMGDALLTEVAHRLRQRLRSADTLARLGGDEFAVLMRHIQGPEAAASLARDLLEGVGQVWRSPVGESEIPIGVSIGIALAPAHGVDSQTLMGSADAALYRAKALGRGTFSYFTPDLTQAAARRMRVEAALRRALSRGGLRLVFQPQYPMGQRAPIGAEALLRWHDPELGVVAPTELVVAAEASGLIASIGAWVLEHAVAAVAAWRSAGWTSVRVAVNVSARQFAQGNLGAQVLGLLERYHVPGEALEVEVTESSLLDGPAAAAATLAQLRQVGATVAIDDFGIGYSSLGYLQRLPVDRIKIDRSFVEKIDHSESERRLCAAIIAMAHHLGLGVVAEGVENEVQHAILSAMGCDAYQGYWQSGHPVPAEEILERVLAERGSSYLMPHVVRRCS